VFLHALSLNDRSNTRLPGSHPATFNILDIWRKNRPTKCTN